MNRKDFLYACGMALPLSWFGCTGRAISPQQTKREEKFSFALFTDVHLNPNDGKNSEEGLRKALRDAKARKVDFIWFGGDNVETDRFPKEDENAANALHARFRQIVDESGMECHFTIGNHDRFYFREGQKDESGYQLFEKYFGPSYHSFDHKGIHFIALNSMDPDKEGNYSIGAEQMEWLQKDLRSVGEKTPIIVSLHVPMLSLYYPVVEGNFKGLDMISNTKPLFELLKSYDLRLVLQGHQHIHEELLERDHWFVTAGAVCANWWNGPLVDTQEGYIVVHVDTENQITWEYIDYKWEAQKTDL